MKIKTKTKLPFWAPNPRDFSLCNVMNKLYLLCINVTKSLLCSVRVVLPDLEALLAAISTGFKTSDKLLCTGASHLWNKLGVWYNVPSKLVLGWVRRPSNVLTAWNHHASHSGPLMAVMKTGLICLFCFPAGNITPSASSPSYQGWWSAALASIHLTEIPLPLPPKRVHRLKVYATMSGYLINKVESFAIGENSL